MYSYIKSIGCKMSSFFSYILNCIPLRKKYKTDEKSNDDEEEIVWYDNIYCDNNNNSQFLHVNLLEE
jgi:hypothetical protein